MIAFIVDVVRGRERRRASLLGASPRAAVHLLAAAKAHARLANRPTVTREDVADMAPFALPHRLIVDGVDPAAVVETRSRSRPPRGTGRCGR